MAKKKATKKAAPKKAAAKPAAPKPIKETLSKSGLVAHIADQTGLASRDVRAVLGSLESTVQGSLSKKGAGSFTLPGLLKITAVNVPAKPRRKGINPFTKEEQWYAATPASVTVMGRPLKNLKAAAACATAIRRGIAAATGRPGPRGPGFFVPFPCVHRPCGKVAACDSDPAPG
jgi:nucleoid DNA-binding protein